MPLECQVLIVGAGLAGLEIAKELDRSGVTDVLVAEAGPAGDLRHSNAAYPPDEAIRLWLAPDRDRYFRRTWSSQCPPHYTGSSGLRQRLGGRSLYWYGVTLPIEPWALTAPWWPEDIVYDLRGSWRGGDALYDRLRKGLSAWRTAGGPPSRADEGNPSARVGDHVLEPVPCAVRRSCLSPDRWYAYSPLDAWRHPETGEVEHLPAHACMFANFAISKITVRGGVARGAIARRGSDGAEVEIGADHVILAAGTIENSRLAIQALAERGQLPGHRLPGLADHIVQGFFLRLAGQHACRVLEAIGSGSYYASCAGPVRSNMFVVVNELVQGEALVDVRLTGEQLPSPDSYVACEPTDSCPWPVAVHSAPSPDDIQVIGEQRRILQQLWEAIAQLTNCPATVIDFGDYSNPARTNAFVLPESIRAACPGQPMAWSSFLGTEDHEGGTLPLGGLLTSQHEFKGIQRLYAAGPSAFPRLGAANPSLTTLALAHRLAAEVADRCQVTGGAQEGRSADPATSHGHRRRLHVPG